MRKRWNALFAAVWLAIAAYALVSSREVAVRLPAAAAPQPKPVVVLSTATPVPDSETTQPTPEPTSAVTGRGSAAQDDYLNLAMLPERSAPVQFDPAGLLGLSLVSNVLGYRSQPEPGPDFPLPTRITIPSIHVDSVVKQVGWQAVLKDGDYTSEWAVADFAVGFHENSARPGMVGNTVMAGHNNIRGEVFRYLNDVSVGDDVSVFAADKTWRYRITQKLLLPEAGATQAQRIANGVWLAPTSDDRLTLVSCWPYTTYNYRVVVIARPIENIQ